MRYNTFQYAALLTIIVIVNHLPLARLAAVKSEEQLEVESQYGLCAVYVPGTRLLKPGYCDRGVICSDDGEAIDDTVICTAPTPFYDPGAIPSKRCNVNSFRASCDAKTGSGKCTATSPPFTADPQTCHGWYACEGKKMLGYGRCPDDLFFDQDKQMCIYPSMTNCTAKYSYCDITANNVKFGNAKNCTGYFVCEGLKGNDNFKTCTSGLYYDSSTGLCVPKSYVKCDNHPYPKDVCGTEKLAKRGRFVGDEATCRGYFFCKDLGSGVPDKNPAWGQCPVETFFDTTLEACVDRAQVKCKEDRCDGRDSGNELSQTRGCKHYLTCSDNRTEEEEACPNNGYFDAITRECTSVVKSYGACT